MYHLIPIFLAIVANCAEETDSSEEPKTEAVCVIEDEVLRSLKEEIFPACIKKKELFDIYQGRCKVPEGEAAINKCKPCACLSLIVAGKAVKFSDC